MKLLMIPAFGYLVAALLALAGHAAAAGEPAPTPAAPAGIPGPSDVLLCAGARIPAIDISAKGTLLAFYERRWSDGDASPHDIHLRRSTDGGRTWGEAIPITSNGKAQKRNYVNVAPVVDLATGTIWAFYTWREHEPERLSQYFRTSRDDGLTWSEEVQLRKEDGALFNGFSSCSRGIQLSSGRLLVPFSDVSDGWRPVMLYSDDGGKKWRFGKPIEGGGKNGWNCIEMSLVELADGAIHLNMRNSSGAASRNVSLSRDGGLTWEKPVARSEFSQPQVNGNGCHSCVMRLSDERRHDRNRLLYSGVPGRKREDLTVQISYDEGKTWQALKAVVNGKSAYSNMIALPDSSIACVYDAEDPGWQVRFARFTLDWLTDGKDKVVAKAQPGAAGGQPATGAKEKE